MRIFEPHIHMISRVTDDYERMAACGITHICEPQFWLGQPRTSVGTFVDYFKHLTEYEVQRAADFGIRHYCNIALNPKEANDRALVRDVLPILDEWLDHPLCMAVGEVGLDSHTPSEEEALRAQLELARRKRMPVMVHTPHREKLKGTRRIIAMIREVGNAPDTILIDHNNEETIPATREAGFWAGHTVYPVTKLSPERACNILRKYGTERMMINSSADWGPSDVTNVPRTVAEMRRQSFTEDQIGEVVWDNPFNFYAQSGKLDMEIASLDRVGAAPRRAETAGRPRKATAPTPPSGRYVAPPL